MAKSSGDARRAAVASLAEAIDRRDVIAAASCLSTDVVVTLPRWGGPWRGRDAVSHALTELFDVCEQTRCVIRESRVALGHVDDQAIIAVRSSRAATPDWLVATATSQAEVSDGLITRLTIDIDADALASQWRGVGLAALSVRSEVALAGFDPDAAVVTDVRTLDPVTHRAPQSARSRRPAALVAALVTVLAVVAAALVLTRGTGDPGSSSPVARDTPSAVVPTTPTPTPSPTPTAILGPSAVPVSGGGVSTRLSGTVLFDRDSAVLKPTSRALIVGLAATLRTTRSGTLTVLGFTDNLGSAALGLQLSQARADAVAAVFRQELAGSGITIAAVGRGEASPVAPNDTESNRAKNRRVEIVYKP